MCLYTYTVLSGSTKVQRLIKKPSPLLSLLSWQQLTSQDFAKGAIENGGGGERASIPPQHTVPGAGDPDSRSSDTIGWGKGAISKRKITTFRFLASTRGIERRTEMNQMVTTVQRVALMLVGDRLVAEYTITLYLFKKREVSDMV